MQQVRSLQEIETVINQNGEMIIGKNKKNNVVIMSLDEYRNNILDDDTVKKLLKSEDDIKNGQEDVQELINKYNKIVDEKFKEKETELMTV